MSAVVMLERDGADFARQVQEANQNVDASRQRILRYWRANILADRG